MNSKEVITGLSRPLDIRDIDFRVQSISAKGFATILPYKDARVDMNRLDEVCGALWQDKYELIDGQLFCSIGVKIGDEWIWRQDVGIESREQAEKGRASDAFKRAGFRWGIGRELYDYPRIQLMLKSGEFTPNGNKGKQTYELQLHKWTWSLERDKDGSILKLTAKDEKGLLRFDSTKDYNSAPKSSAAPKSNQAPKQPIKNDNSNKLTAAILKVNACNDMNALQEIWNANADLQANKAFVKIVNSRKLALKEVVNN